MFWLGTGPRDADTALAASLGHDKHNIWVVGSSDAAMARAVNALNDIQGGWALVRGGELAATVTYEVGGLMSCRPAADLDRDMQALYAAGAGVDWMYEPTYLAALVARFSRAAEFRHPHLRAVALGAGGALAAGTGGVRQRRDGPDAPDRLVVPFRPGPGGVRPRS
jgi:hypothetical protein